MKGDTLPGPNKIVVKFNKQFWELIEIDFTRMIILVIDGGCLESGSHCDVAQGRNEAETY